VTITLPPLPEPVYTFDEDGNKVFYEKAALVRARDLEVARAVLEGAALKCEGERRLGIDDERAYYGDLMAEAIRELEVKHHE
jgi:hypothetical protein